jgi:hypothetical protein
VSILHTRSSTGSRDTGEDGAYFVLNMPVCEAQDAQPASRQNSLSFSVVIHLMIMNRSINLNDEPGNVTIEINYGAVEYLLATETQSMYLIATQMVPERALGSCHRAP